MSKLTKKSSCPDNTPPWFTGHWRDWHRGHGCYQDDGKDRSDAAVIEIEQHKQNKQNAGTGYLTDAELRFLRARTTSGDELLVRALDELKARRSAALTNYFMGHAETGAGRLDKDGRVV